MAKPLYAVLAALVGAYRRCVDTQNVAWMDNHRLRIQTLVREHMPSGSGTDSGTRLDLEKSKENRLHFCTAFHHMSDSGMYDGWTHHDVIVTPHLAYGIDVKITGPNRNDIKNLIHEVFWHDLTQEVEPYAKEEKDKAE